MLKECICPKNCAQDPVNLMVVLASQGLFEFHDTLEIIDYDSTTWRASRLGPGGYAVC